MWDWLHSRKSQGSALLNFKVYQTASVSRVTAAFLVSLVSAGTIFHLTITVEPFTTHPFELLGSYAYITDLNITNRLAAVTIAILCTLAAFHLFMTGLYNIGAREENAIVAIGHGLLPVFIWLSSIFLHPQANIDPFWVYLSTILCWGALWGFWWEAHKAIPGGHAEPWLSALAMSCFLLPALMSGLKPGLLYYSAEQAPDLLTGLAARFRPWLWSAPILVFILGLVLTDRKKLLAYVLFPLQLLLLPFFCTVLPDGFLVNGKAISLIPPGLFFLLIVMPLILVGIWDCTSRCLLDKGKSPVSPLVFLGFLFFLLFQQEPIPGYKGNSFEHGARFVPFWAVYEGWASLFKDIHIPYGLWDYSRYWLGAFFSGEFSASVGPYGGHIQMVLALCLGFWAASQLLPLSAVFFLFYLFTNQETLAIYPLVCVLLLPGLLQHPIRWTGVWLLISAIVPFARVPQGATFVAATIPAFLWQARILHRTKPKDFWGMLGGLALLGLLFLIGPLSGYFWGLTNMFWEYAQINSHWAATGWEISKTPFLMVLLGNSSMILPLLALIIGMGIMQQQDKNKEPFAAYFLVTLVTLYTLFSISHGFSRTDFLPYQRQYRLLGVVLPMVVTFALIYIPKGLGASGMYGGSFGLPCHKSPPSHISGVGTESHEHAAVYRNRTDP